MHLHKLAPHHMVEHVVGELARQYGSCYKLPIPVIGCEVVDAFEDILNQKPWMDNVCDEAPNLKLSAKSCLLEETCHVFE